MGGKRTDAKSAVKRLESFLQEPDSDTPETDRETTKFGEPPSAMVLADFARKLERERDEWKERYAKAYGRLAGALAERDEAGGIILACHRAFSGGSDYVQKEARRIAANWVEKYHPPANATSGGSEQ